MELSKKIRLVPPSKTWASVTMIGSVRAFAKATRAAKGATSNKVRRVYCIKRWVLEN